MLQVKRDVNGKGTLGGMMGCWMEESGEAWMELSGLRRGVNPILV
jgi:hypothetical protein